jgi:dienelactone hydrolase
MARALPAALVASLLCALAACHHRDASGRPPAVAPSGPPLSIAGDPESASGATWTLRGILDGTPVDLRGILLKPRGRGPFPAVVLSHGAGGNAQSYGRAIGGVMRSWGLVGIAVDYTHARGAPLGAPGTRLQQGASQANAFRAHAAVTVLERLGYVDTRRVAAHGHSMGAFVTIAFVAAYPEDIRVASHTSGGVLLDAIHHEGMPMASVAQARRIRAPYQWHHGLLDYAVPFLLDRRFDSVLTAPHEGHLYPRLRHAEVAADPQVLSRVRAWYTAQGMFEAPAAQRPAASRATLRHAS